MSEGLQGGGAVYHDLGNLNFSFIVKDRNENMDFQKFTDPVINALSRVGIKAEYTGRNDITVDGKKFSGNAQYHYKGKTLHHGTIHFDSRLEDVQAALNVKAAKIESKGIKSVRSRVTNLVEYMEDKITISEFRDLLLQYLFGEEPIQKYELNKDDQRCIQELMKNKYLTWEWNYGTSPTFNLTKSDKFDFGSLDVFFNIESGIIKNCKIYGDFFSDEDINLLSEIFQGVRYREKELEELLKNIDLSRYLNAITREKFLQLII